MPTVLLPAAVAVASAALMVANVVVVNITKGIVSHNVDGVNTIGVC